MIRMAQLVPLWLLLCSILVNILFLLNHQQLSWSRRAAEEAEAAASIACSGNGRAFVDGLESDDGKPVCECDGCFHGPDCSHFLSDCPANADGGDPLFLEPFWMKHAASSAVLVAGWHRMSYLFPDQSYVSGQLEILIRKLHATVNNAVTDERYIIFGCGSTQLISAAVFALSSKNSSSPSRVVASTPYYPVYRSQTDFFHNSQFEFEGDVSLVQNHTDDLDLIELVTSPNNPDCLLKKAVLDGPFSNTIYDHAYYWPHFTAIPKPVDIGDVMLFTISKITGHAGSRFGWAIVKEKGVYERMQQYIMQAELGVSRDAQLRALKLLRVVLAQGNGKDIFDFGYKTLMERWKRLNQIISASRRFSLQKIVPQYCNFLNKVKDPSPAYGWLKCEYEDDTDCTEVLKAANIIGRRGRMFNAEDRYVRLSLLKRQADFELLLERLKVLVSTEDERTAGDV